MSMMDVLIAPLDVFRRGAQMLAEANSTEWSGLVPHPPVGHVEPCEQDRDAFTAKLLWEIMALPVRGSYLYSPGSWERGRWRDWHQQRKTLEPDPYYPLFGLVALNFSALGRNYLRVFFLIHTERFSSHVLLPQRWIDSCQPADHWSRTLDVSRPETHAAVAKTHFTSVTASQNCCLSFIRIS